jgi:hypothetical protein
MSNKRLMPVFEAAWRAVSESAKRSEAQRVILRITKCHEVSEALCQFSKLRGESV